MKTIFVLAIVTLSILKLCAQGTVVFNNNVPGVVVTHIYFEPASPNPTFGNGPNDFPAGSQTYSNNKGLFSGYAQLFASDRPDADASHLWEASPVFAVANGTILNPSVVSLTDIPADSAAAMLQLRVWVNYSGFATNWWTAVGQQETAGMSPTFKVQNIGGEVNPAAYLTGLQSFAVPLTSSVPEPSTSGLVIMGVVGILLRQKYLL